MKPIQITHKDIDEVVAVTNGWKVTGKLPDIPIGIAFMTTNGRMDALIGDWVKRTNDGSWEVIRGSEFRKESK